jgi:hypothetical protein
MYIKQRTRWRSNFDHKRTNRHSGVDKNRDTAKGFIVTITMKMSASQWKTITKLSEEISSRMAECTRLILVKDGFGGDSGVLDQWTDEHMKNTEI